MAISFKSFFLLHDNPKDSDMSISSGLISLGSFQLKWYSNWERTSSMVARAKDMPGHILLPPPNGMNSKFAPLKSIWEPWNLSGWKQSASLQYSVSLPMVHALIITLVLLGISYCKDIKVKVRAAVSQEADAETVRWSDCGVKKRQCYTQKRHKNLYYL